jgi:hypothetical protein
MRALHARTSIAAHFNLTKNAKTENRNANHDLDDT